MNLQTLPTEGLHPLEENEGCRTNVESLLAADSTIRRAHNFSAQKSRPVPIPRPSHLISSRNTRAFCNNTTAKAFSSDCTDDSMAVTPDLVEDYGDEEPNDSPSLSILHNRKCLYDRATWRLYYRMVQHHIQQPRHGYQSQRHHLWNEDDKHNEMIDRDHPNTMLGRSRLDTSKDHRRRHHHHHQQQHSNRYASTPDSILLPPPNLNAGEQAGEGEDDNESTKSMDGQIFHIEL